MVKKELSDALAQRCNLSKSEAMRVIDNLMDIISNSLINKNNIYLRGFGTFKIEYRHARKGRNIVGGEIVSIPARNVIKFIPNVELKNKIK